MNKQVFKKIWKDLNFIKCIYINEKKDWTKYYADFFTLTQIFSQICKYNYLINKIIIMNEVKHNYLDVTVNLSIIYTMDSVKRYILNSKKPAYI